MWLKVSSVKRRGRQFCFDKSYSLVDDKFWWRQKAVVWLSGPQVSTYEDLLWLQWSSSILSGVSETVAKALECGDEKIRIECQHI